MARIHRRALQLPQRIDHGGCRWSIARKRQVSEREEGERRRRRRAAMHFVAPDIYIYIYTTANISPLDLTPRELGWSIANNQFGNRRFQSVTSLGRGGARRRGKEAVSAVQLVVVVFVLIVSTLDDVSVNIRGGVWNNLISCCSLFLSIDSINFFVESSITIIRVFLCLFFYTDVGGFFSFCSLIFIRGCCCWLKSNMNRWRYIDNF